MKVLLIIIGVIVVIIIALYINVKVGSLKSIMAVMDKLKPISDALENNVEPDINLIRHLATDPIVRNELYNTLKKYDKTDLFPEKYRNKKYYTESDLVLWLSHPNELRQAPDEIELMEVIRAGSIAEIGEIEYYLFRFRTEPPNFAADTGWMAGVSGPYLIDDNAPLITPPGTFSEFEAYDLRPPQEHVKYFHECVSPSSIAEWRKKLNEELK